MGFRIADGEAALRFSMVDFERASLNVEVVAKSARLPELSGCEPSALSPDAATLSRGIPSGSDDVDSWEGPLLEKREKWGTPRIV